MKTAISVTGSLYLVGCLLGLALTTGCMQQTGMQASASDLATANGKPFAQTADVTGLSPTGSLMSQAVPAGTSVAIRLETALSSERSQAGDSFAGALDEPIVVDGITVAAKGALVTGTVLAAKPSVSGEDPGYLRIVLKTVAIHDRPVSVDASSIFTKGGFRSRNHSAPAIVAATQVDSAPVTENEDVTLSPQHRLIFRLTHSLTLEN